MISICGVICYFLIVSRLTQALSSLCFVDSLNNVSVEDRFEIRFSIKVGICLIIFEGWLDSIYMYYIYSLVLKEIPTIQHKQNKYYLCLNEKLEIDLKAWNQLINKCRNQNKFTILRHDSNDWKFRFHWIIFCSILIRLRGLACAINDLNNMVFKTKIEKLQAVVSLGSNAGDIFCEDGTEITSPFRLDTITL